jgi:glycosyltransferase involved in cell wall biosynthesis
VTRLPPHFTVLQVTPELETGGAEQTTIDVAAAVVKAHGRSLVASRGGRMAAQLTASGAALVEMPVHSKSPLTILANAMRLAMLIEREKVNLIHVRSRAPAFSALIAAHAMRIPFVATYHGVYSGGGALKRWYNAIMTRGDVVIANSEFTRAHVIAEHKIDADRVITIPRGVDLSRFDPAKVSAQRLAALRARWSVVDDEPRVKILLAGRLTRWKGQRLLIDAAALLKAGGRDEFLVLLAGDDQGRSGYRQELEAAIAAAGLGEAVRLVGHCDDMPAAYLIADIVCTPSLAPEAFGRTAVEPQIMGRPVLAADHGGARETVLVGETGWLVAPGETTQWAKALAAAIDAGPKKRAAMGQAGAARARRLYSAQAMCEATLKVYARLVGRRG